MRVSFESRWKRDGDGKEEEERWKRGRVTDLSPMCTGLCEMPRDSEREISIFASRSILDRLVW